MIFKDRSDAGEKLLAALKGDKYFKRTLVLKKLIVVSLLRGGVIVGNVLASGFKSEHLPLVVTKIPAPNNAELAIGALCFSTIYLEKRVVESLGLTKLEISNQIKIARTKFNSYLARFKIREVVYSKRVKGAVVVLVDDGIATGATVKAASLYLKERKPKKIILAVPVAPADFATRGFDKVFILHRDISFGAVSQFYEDFPQIEDTTVRSLLGSSIK